MPTAFRWAERRDRGAHARVRGAVKRMTGFDLYPDETTARRFGELLLAGDPVAEQFVAQTYHGELGPTRSRELLDRALAVGVEHVPEAPASMRQLFAEFERIPDWVRPELVERGAAVWRRWGYALGAMANAATMDTYTEGSLAVPLSLSGGYAGERALNRYLETSRWWIEVCRPGAALTAGSLGRSISLKVRVMHVSVRQRVAAHPEWDAQRWGLPISQVEMLLTLVGGTVAPGVGLTALGYLTSKSEIEAALHFNRYLGHLVGVRCDDIFPRTLGDGLRLLYLFDTARSYDSGDCGRELVESFVPAFAPRPGERGFARLRKLAHRNIMAGHAQLFMLPWNRSRYRLPAPWIGLAILFGRAPFVLAAELSRRLHPAIDRLWQRQSVRSWERWLRWQSPQQAQSAPQREAGAPESFEAAHALRR
ncbi:oxygenase MpaB family protein [Segniliparus rotundus]|uniref:oxygenase MpaB family protein n=1 Tax=Segniliparus rotundus TaxID=286802 RepID=UPI000673FC87